MMLIGSELTSPETLAMRKEMKAEALRYMKEVEDKNPNKRLCNPNTRTITTAEDLVEDLLYLEHDSPIRFKSLYQTTRHVGIVQAKFLEYFRGYNAFRRAA